MFKRVAVLLLTALLVLMPVCVASADPLLPPEVQKLLNQKSTGVLAGLDDPNAVWQPSDSTDSQDSATTTTQPATDPFNFNCKAALLLDYDTGTVLYEKNADQKLQVASVTKVMTLLLSFEALEQGKFDLDEEVTISKQAAGMGGSQALLDANGKYKAGELIKSIIVASANDSSVAMAELIAGSESLFVEQMNARAKELGMNNTNFANCTGLPTNGAYTTARDVSIMSKELLKHPMFFQYSKVWMYDMQHSGGRVTQLSNTNKLTRFYDGCDGVKTGSTDEAGYCLSATAKRGDSRFVAIIVGATTSAERNDYITKLLDYAFATYKSVTMYNEGDIVQSNVTVWGGQLATLNAISPQKVSALVKKGEENKVSKQITIYDPVQAPIERGAQVGTVKILKDGKEIAQYPLIADRDVLEAGFWSNFIKILHSFK
jgi:serine-type D-Ala-D-Ala carboxypeptidase (penicillin-binding protein 5/6)